MAATNYTPIQLYRTTTLAAAPVSGNLTSGELAINVNDADMALYAKNNTGTVTRLMNNPAGLKYPTADGTANQVITTNGSGVLTLVTPQVTSATLSASTGSTLIGTIQSGTGSVPRTVASKINDTVSVKDFGAIGNGVADDYAAIQSAVSLGNSIYFPPGTYLISSTILVSLDNTQLTGASSAVIKKTFSGAAISISAKNCLVSNMEVNGNSLGDVGIALFGESNMVDTCTIYGNLSHGIMLDGQASTCTYNTVTNCNVRLNSGVGISANTAPNSIRTNNIVSFNGLEGITDDLPSYRSIINNNYLTDNCLIGGVGGIGIDQASDATVTGNVINNTQSGLPAICFQNNIGSTNFVTVTANTIVNNLGGGILLRNGTGGTCNNNVLADNTFQNNTGYDISINAGCVGNSVSGIPGSVVIVDANSAGVNAYSGLFNSVDTQLVNSSVIVGHSSTPLTGKAITVQGTTAGVGVFGYNNTAATQAYFNQYRSRGTTVGSPTVVQSGDGLGRLTTFGYDGSNYVVATEIRAESDGVPGVGSMPGRLVFATTKTGASSPTVAARIDNQQRIGFPSIDTRCVINISGHTGTTTGLAYYHNSGVIPTSATSYCTGYWGEITTPAGAVTYNELSSFKSQPGTTGANSITSNIFGFMALETSPGTGASIGNQSGYWGLLSAGVGRYNLYMGGTAANYLAGDLLLSKTVTGAGTTGARTINATTGTVNFAATATSLVVTNSLVTVNSIIIATVGTNDTTMKSVQAVAAAGSFTLYASAAATAETRVNFHVTN